MGGRENYYKEEETGRKRGGKSRSGAMQWVARVQPRAPVGRENCRSFKYLLPFVCSS